MCYFLLVYILMKDKRTKIPTMYSYWTLLRASDESTEWSPLFLHSLLGHGRPLHELSRGGADVMFSLSSLHHMLEMVEMFQPRGGSRAPVKLHQQLRIIYRWETWALACLHDLSIVWPQTSQSHHVSFIKRELITSPTSPTGEGQIKGWTSHQRVSEARTAQVLGSQSFSRLLYQKGLLPGLNGLRYCHG